MRSVSPPWRWIAALIVLGSAAVAVLGNGPRAIGEAEGSLFVVGEDALPATLAPSTIARATSSLVCSDGSFVTVETVGSTTIENLAKLQPSMPGVESWVRSADPQMKVYAAVMSGDCMVNEGGLEYLAPVAYAVVGDDGFPMYYRVWRADLAPQLNEPFGPRVDAAINVDIGEE